MLTTCRALLTLLFLSSLFASAESGRFVRVELSGNGRSLTLAEVQVFSGGKDVEGPCMTSDCQMSLGSSAS